MNKLKFKYIAYWNQYKMRLERVPADQEYYISESLHRTWEDGKIILREYSYERIKLDWTNELNLKAIKRVNLDRCSSELYDYWIWLNRKNGY